MPKDDSKSKDGTVTVNIEEFTKTRDSVLASLAQLQAAAFELSRAYINHTNTVLGQDTPNVDLAAFTNITASLRESGLLGPSVATAAAGDDKRKRKRAKPDPNAPKRALTPFFLYMKHNRQTIAAEMGDKAKRNKDVSDEGTRRWAAMPDSQKEIWKKMYADNLATYREQVAAYKAGKADGDDHEKDQAANQLQGDVEAAQASADESSESESEDEEEVSPEPVKEPTPPPPKRRRSEGKPSSPVKKRGGKKEEPPKPPASETKRNKKKRKSDIGGDA
ncbi:high mobility group box domain-containing protein [Aspergillus heterothallicus]